MAHSRIIAAVAGAAAIVAGACVDATGPAVIRIDDAPGAVRWEQVTVGVQGSCALLRTQDVYCWGVRAPIVCDDTGCRADLQPTRTAPGFAVRRIQGGDTHRCIITADSELWCWGVLNPALGDGITARSTAPVQVSTDAPVNSVAISAQRVCALSTDGSAWCWGRGVLGDDARQTEAGAPIFVSTALRFSEITAGTSQTCALAQDGTGHCWGRGYGSLGIGVRDTSCEGEESCYVATVPEPIDGGHHWKTLSAGHGFTCGVTTEDRGYCWGNVQTFTPQDGRLGSGEFAWSKSPVAVTGDLRWRTIVAGSWHACGLTLDGDAYCWGENSAGQLGGGLRGGRYATPQRVAGGIKFRSLDVGQVTCGISINDNLYCWGFNVNGSLGTGMGGQWVSAVPVRVGAPVESQ